MWSFLYYVLGVGINPQNRSRRAYRRLWNRAYTPGTNVVDLRFPHAWYQLRPNRDSIKVRSYITLGEGGEAVLRGYP